MQPRYRPLSPSGGRRYLPPEQRMSTGQFYVRPAESSVGGDTRAPRDSNYSSPRSSNERVIPVSTEHYVNGTLVGGSRVRGPYEPADDRPRRGSTFSEYGSTRAAQPRNPVIHHDDRGSTVSSSSSSRPSRYDGEYFVTPATSGNRPQRRKVYSIDDGKPRLLESGDRLDPRASNDRTNRPYHLAGPRQDRDRIAEIDENRGYEFTNAREMFETTEPQWRPRRMSSVDTASRRDRPSSMVEQSRNGQTGRDTRETRPPPPALRMLDRIRDPLARTSSLRESATSPAHLRDRVSEDDNYPIAPRIRSARPDIAHFPDRPRGRSPSEERVEERRPSGSRYAYADSDIATRGFGIRVPQDERNLRSHSIDSRSPYPREPVAAPQTRKEPPDTTQSDSKLDRDHKSDERVRDREVRPREKDKDRDHDRDLEDEPRRPRERRTEPGVDSRDKDTRDRRRDDDHGIAVAATTGTVSAGLAAVGAKELYDHSKREHRDDSKDGRERRDRIDKNRDSPRSSKDDVYHGEDDNKTDPKIKQSESADPDEEYRQRLRQEAERFKADSKDSDTKGDSDRERERQRRRKEREERRAHDDASRRGDPGHPLRDDSSKHDALYADDSRQLTHTRSNDVDRASDSVLDGPVSEEPSDVSTDSKSKRVSIVEPAREERLVKSILRKPTEKFPEDPNPIREGVAPLKDAKNKNVPPGARWTKINRSLVNPEALEEAGERYEERKDFVIVLRVLSKDDIQKYADRTRDIRNRRYDESHGHHHSGSSGGGNGHSGGSGSSRHHYHRDREDDRHRGYGARDDDYEDDEEDAPKQIEWH